MPLPRRLLLQSRLRHQLLVLQEARWDSVDWVVETAPGRALTQDLGFPPRRQSRRPPQYRRRFPGRRHVPLLLPVGGSSADRGFHASEPKGNINRCLFKKKKWRKTLFAATKHVLLFIILFGLLAHRLIHRKLPPECGVKNKKHQSYLGTVKYYIVA